MPQMPTWAPQGSAAQVKALAASNLPQLQNVQNQVLPELQALRQQFQVDQSYRTPLTQPASTIGQQLAQLAMFRR
jgi:hypothetical protein